MEEDDNFADDLAEFIFGQSYNRRYRITIIDLLKDILKYLKLLPSLIISLFDRDLLKDLIGMRKQENVKSISFSNLKGLLKVNVAMFKKMEEINKRGVKK